jgi:hypothetical protein
MEPETPARPPSGGGSVAPPTGPARSTSVGPGIGGRRPFPVREGALGAGPRGVTALPPEIGEPAAERSARRCGTTTTTTKNAYSNLVSA